AGTRTAARTATSPRRPARPAGVPPCGGATGRRRAPLRGAPAGRWTPGPPRSRLAGRSAAAATTAPQGRRRSPGAADASARTGPPPPPPPTAPPAAVGAPRPRPPAG